MIKYFFHTLMCWSATALVRILATMLHEYVYFRNQYRMISSIYLIYFIFSVGIFRFTTISSAQLLEPHIFLMKFVPSILFVIMVCQLFVLYEYDLSSFIQTIFNFENNSKTMNYLCKGIPRTFDCPETLYYNPELQLCDYPANVPICVGGTRPPIEGSEFHFSVFIIILG